MTEEFKRRLLLRPLKPFRVVLRDGTQIDVVRIAQVAVGLTRFMCALPDNERVREFKLADIVALESLEGAPV